GLSVVRRLALDAQREGARGIVVPPESGVVPEVVRDARLSIPLATSAPLDARTVSVPANTLLHRGALGATVRSGGTRVDPGAAPPDGTPFGFAAVAVVDARSARIAERALFRSLRKPQDGWTARWLNRYVSLALSRFLVRTPFSPNQ